jgi:hypothetical protein
MDREYGAVERRNKQCRTESVKSPSQTTSYHSPAILQLTLFTPVSGGSKNLIGICCGC